ncbi:autotransporter outer membrane beta-barrel domain-containing protein [Thalassotalea euphylliae]|nr:autotransporter outer membrane beta-barrel domain-containing protein [Thalassotalea euphylliae]
MDKRINVSLLTSTLVIAPHIYINEINANEINTDQIKTNLGTIGVTELQQRMGDAVQTVCGGFVVNGTDGSKQQNDLFNRCGEMVHTANRLNGINGPRAKDLGVSAAELANYLQHVAGEEVATQSNVITDAMMGQNALIAERLSSLMNTMGGIAYTAPESNVTGFNFQSQGLGASSDGNEKWGVYASVKGGFGEKDATDRENAFDLDDYNVLVGIDYLLNNEWVMGISYGYRDMEADYDVTDRVPDTQMDVTTDTISLYGLYHQNDFYLSAVVDFGSSEFDLARQIQIISTTDAPGAPNRTLSSSTDSDQHAVTLDVGYQMVSDNRTVMPYLKVSYLDIEIDSFAESDSSQSNAGEGGGLALAYQKQEIESLKSILGGQISWVLNRDYGVMSPYILAEWHYEHDDESRAITAQYVHDPRNNLVEFVTDDPDSNYFNVGAGISMVYPNGIQAFIDVSTILALEDFDYTSVTVGVRKAF